MNAVLAANRADLEECCTNLIELIGELDDNALNWVPPIGDTNSIAGLVLHSMSALSRWLARGVGAPLPEIDRKAELAGHSTSTALIAAIHHATDEAHSRLCELDGLDLGETMVVNRATGPSQSVSRAWCATHAIGHVREHWGHIQLTAQLYAKSPKPN